MPPAVVLVGAPGAGKTAVGSAVAARLGLPFRDTDHDTEEAAGATITEIFVDEGESGFRKREREAVRAALTGARGVVALGGGAVEDPDTRTDLREGAAAVVWLQVGANEAAKRAGISGPRPLLLGNVRTTWLGQLRRREPLYREVADFEVTTDDRSEDEIAAEVVAVLTEEKHL